MSKIHATGNERAARERTASEGIAEMGIFHREKPEPVSEIRNFRLTKTQNARLAEIVARVALRRKVRPNFSAFILEAIELWIAKDRDAAEAAAELPKDA